MQNLFSSTKNFKNVCCIYQIIIQNKSYVGSTVDLNSRLSGHRNDLLKKKHHSAFLQNIFNKYGKDHIYFTVLYNFENRVSKLERLLKEKEYIELLNPEFNSVLDPTTQYNSKTQSKKVYQYTLEGIFIKEWNSTAEVARELSIQCSAVCRKVSKNKSAGGFLWSYEKYDLFPIKYENNSRYSKIESVTIYTLEGRKIETFPSIAECVKKYFTDFPFESACSRVSYCSTHNASFNKFRFSKKDSETIEETKATLKNFPIVQYDKNMKFIRVWENCVSAQKELNIKHQISTVLDKDKKCAKCYWKKLTGSVTH